MERVIQKHLDKVEDQEDRFDKDLNKLIQAIDIDAVIDDPEVALISVIDEVEEILAKKYLKGMADLGRDLAKQIESLKDNIL